MEQYFADLINSNYQHISNILFNYGYNVKPSTEILLRAYELHGDSFLNDIYSQTLNYTSNYTANSIKKNWLNTMALSIGAGKTQGTEEQKDWGLTDDAKEIIDENNNVVDKKTFWEKTKNIWDKALPFVNAGTSILNSVDSEVVNPKQEEITPPPDIIPKSNENKNTIWYIIGGIGVVAVAVVLYFVLKDK